MKGFEKALGGKHDGVADSAMRALWLSQTDTPKVISADSHDWTQSGPTPPPSSPCHAARDPMLEFCSYPHTCGVIGKPFASVSVPSLKDLVSKVLVPIAGYGAWLITYCKLDMSSPQGKPYFLPSTFSADFRHFMVHVLYICIATLAPIYKIQYTVYKIQDARYNIQISKNHSPDSLECFSHWTAHIV